MKMPLIFLHSPVPATSNLKMCGLLKQFLVDRNSEEMKKKYNCLGIGAHADSNFLSSVEYKLLEVVQMHFQSQKHIK